MVEKLGKRGGALAYYQLLLPILLLLTQLLHHPATYYYRSMLFEILGKAAGCLSQEEENAGDEEAVQTVSL